MAAFAYTLIFFLFSLPAWGATYYFANGGNDGGSCTDINAPCASLSRAQSVSWTSGSQILFRCGDTFRGSGAAFDTQGANVTIGRYGPACTSNMDTNPTLTQSTLVTGWTSAGTNLWQKTGINANAGPDWFFNRLRAAWREDHDSGCPGSMNQEYEICYNSARNTVYVRTTAGDPDNLNAPGVEQLATAGGAMVHIEHHNVTWDGVNIKQASNWLGIDGTNTGNGFVMKNSHHANSCYRDTLGLGRCTSFGGWGFRIYNDEGNGNFTFQNNKFQGCGRDCFDIDSAMGDGTIILDNNEWYEGYNHGATNLAKDTAGTDMANGTFIFSNNVGHDICGVFIGFGDGNDGGFANLRLINNFAYNQVLSSDVLPRYHVNNGRQCGTQDAGIQNVGNDAPITLYAEGNIIMDHVRGMIFKNGESGTSITVVNNVFYENEQVGLALANNIPKVVRNNAFIRNGSNSTGWPRLQIACQTCSGSLDINYNYFVPNHSSHYVTNWNGTNYTLAQADSNITGWNSQNLGVNFGATPTLFVNPAGHDFTPAPGSVLIDAGTAVSGRTCVGSCDIGAVESGFAPSPPEIEYAVVEALSPSTMVVGFTADVPPMLPASNCHTGWSLSATSASITGCTRTAAQVFTFTLNQDIDAADFPLLSYNPATGNTTDSTPLELATLTNWGVINHVGKSIAVATNLSTWTGTFAAGRELVHMFDTDTTTEAGSTGNSNITQFSFTNDFGSVQDIGLTRLFGDNAGTWQCSNYQIDYSTDCSSYTTYATNLNCNGNNWWEQTLGVSARCLRVTINGPAAGTQAREWEVYTAQAPDPPGSPTTFYVDNTCGTNGNGTTETCGATGPWNTIKNALQVADCAGMVPGDILQINGDAVKDLTCEGAGTNCYFEDNVNVEGACTGIIIQNKMNDHVVVNGTVDIKGSTWTSIGSGVYECQTSGCSGDVGDFFAFRAWYDRGNGEEALDLEQSNQVCDTSLGVGKMRITQSSQRICVHLSDGSSPANASYFRVPWFWPFLQLGADSSINNVIRANPIGTGSFTVERYRFTGIEYNSTDNPGTVVQGMTWTEMLDRCIANSDSSIPDGVGNIKILNNTVSFCGQEGIRVSSDSGAFEVTGNTVTDIQTVPMFEKCTGVGTGCLSGFTDNGTAIRIINGNGVGGLIANNTILRVGGGRQGRGRGINLENETANNIVENNYIAHMSGLPLEGTAINITGSFAGDVHNGNIIRNNRMHDVDICFWMEIGSEMTGQAGTTNSYLNNTCSEFWEYGIRADGSSNFDGTMILQNNIMDAGTKSPTFFISVVTSGSTGWQTLENNAFECTACSTDQDIINWKGTRFERDADCTGGVDCIADMSSILGAGFSGNDYGSINLDTDGSEPSLQISSPSIAIDTGKTLSNVTLDHAGTMRPQGAAYDMGAFEAEATAPPPIEGSVGVQGTGVSMK